MDPSIVNWPPRGGQSPVTSSVSLCAIQVRGRNLVKLSCRSSWSSGCPRADGPGPGSASRVFDPCLTHLDPLEIAMMALVATDRYCGVVDGPELRLPQAMVKFGLPF